MEVNKEDTQNHVHDNEQVPQDEQKEQSKEKETISGIFSISPKKLKEHSKNIEIYGKEGVDKALKESIRDLGQLEPIVIDQEYRIISGHRRWKALKELQKEEEQKKKENKEYKEIEALCFMKPFSLDVDEEEAIIEFNKHRKKNPLQIFRETELLEDIYTKRADERKKSKLKQNSVNSDLSYRSEEYGSTTEKQAKVIGLSEGTLSNLKYIGKLYNDKDKDAKYVMDEMKSDNLSIDAGYKLLKLMEAAKDPNAKEDSPQEIKDIAAKAKELVDKAKAGAVTPNKADKDFEKYKKEHTNKPPKMIAVPPPGVYNVIVADPKNADEAQKTETKISKDSALFLWATTQNLEDRLGLMRSWGFSLKSIGIYDAERKPGVYFNGVVEFVLFGLKGNLEPVEDYQPDIIFKKSEKDKSKYMPVYQIAMKLFPSGSYVDPFHETELENWGKPTFEEDIEDKKDGKASSAI